MRLLIVEDDDLFARGLARILSLMETVEGVAIARGEAEAVAEIKKRPPDVALVDHDLGPDEKTGCAIIGELLEQSQKTRVLVLTGDYSPAVAARALEQGADGYLHKSSILDRLSDAMKIVQSGGTFIDPLVLRQVVAPLREKAVPASRESLTPDLLT